MTFRSGELIGSTQSQDVLNVNDGTYVRTTTTTTSPVVTTTTNRYTFQHLLLPNRYLTHRFCTLTT